MSGFAKRQAEFETNEPPKRPQREDIRTAGRHVDDGFEGQLFDPRGQWTQFTTGNGNQTLLNASTTNPGPLQQYGEMQGAMDALAEPIDDPLGRQPTWPTNESRTEFMGAGQTQPYGVDEFDEQIFLALSQYDECGDATALTPGEEVSPEQRAEEAAADRQAPFAGVDFFARQPTNELNQPHEGRAASTSSQPTETVNCADGGPASSSSVRPDQVQYPGDLVPVPEYPLAIGDYTPDPETGRYSCRHSYKTQQSCCQNGFSREQMMASVNKERYTWKCRVERLIVDGKLDRRHMTWPKFQDRKLKRTQPPPPPKEQASSSGTKGKGKQVQGASATTDATSTSQSKKNQGKSPASPYNPVDLDTQVSQNNPTPTFEDASQPTTPAGPSDDPMEAAMKIYQQEYLDCLKVERNKPRPDWKRFNGWWDAKRSQIQGHRLPPAQQAILKDPEPSSIPCGDAESAEEAETTALASNNADTEVVGIQECELGNTSGGELGLTEEPAAMENNGSEYMYDEEEMGQLFGDNALGSFYGDQGSENLYGDEGLAPLFGDGGVSRVEDPNMDHLFDDDALDRFFRNDGQDGLS